MIGRLRVFASMENTSMFAVLDQAPAKVNQERLTSLMSGS